jgi:hypothetical protein
MRRPWSALLILLAPGIARAQTVAPPELSDYAILGVTGTTVRRASRVVSGAVGSLQGTVRLGREGRVTNAVAGPMIHLASGARTGRLFCHLVSGPPTLPLCNAFTDPLIDPAGLVPVPVVPGTDDLRIPAQTGTAPVPPGSFRDVRVGAKSVLQLYGGAYSMRSLRVGTAGRVVCASDCAIHVLGTVRLQRAAELGADSPVRASGARVDIAASGPPAAFVARPRANVSATIFAPAGRVVLGSLGNYRGAFIGRTVLVGPNATVRGDSAL